MPRQSRVGAKSPWRAPAYVMLALLLASPAFAQGVDVTASLDITDGWARVGAYVPVTFKVTNRTDTEIAEVFVTTGGPVDVRSDLRLATGETAEKVLPVFYVGGDLPLWVEFLTESGATVARTEVTARETRALPGNMALVAVSQDGPDLEDAMKTQGKSVTGKRVLHILRLPFDRLETAAQCGVLHAGAGPLNTSLTDGTPMITPSRSGVIGVGVPPFPLGVRSAIQPGVYRLLGAAEWPASERLRLWTWLGLFALAVVVAAVLVPARRAVAGALVLVVLAGAAAGLIYWLGLPSGSRVCNTRIFYRRLQGSPQQALEEITLLQSRGGASARCPTIDVATLPLPIFASSDDLVRPSAVMDYGYDYGYHVETRGPPLVVHVLSLGMAHICESVPFDFLFPHPDRNQLAHAAEDPTAVKALLIEGSRATDADGRSQTINAWAVEWQGSDDPDVAYAGRSLKWWDSDRREGDGPFLLAWFHDPVSDHSLWKGAQVVRLPALVVYSEAPKQD